MNTALSILSIVLLYTSHGSINLHIKAVNKVSGWHNKTQQTISILIGVITFIIPIFPMVELTGFKWYYCLVINLFTIKIFSEEFANLYAFIIGFKGKERLSLTEGKMVKDDIFSLNAILTLVIGIILYFL